MNTRNGMDSFVHPALFYRDDAAYLAGTVPFVLDGLAKDEPVAVAVPGERLRLLRGELGAAAERVRLLDMTEAGRNPGRIIPGVLMAFADRFPTGRVRIIGEPIWASRTEEEYPACVQHEALINLAFHGRSVTVLCPYDAAGLDADVLADARATHPVVIDDGVETASAAYAPERGIAAGNRPLPAPATAASLDFDDATLPDARYFAVSVARGFGLAERPLDDLALAVAELTTNSVLHGGGRGTVRLWHHDGRVYCQVEDAGRLGDPLAGRLARRPEQIGGRGLLVVNQVSELVRAHTADTGTTIRFRMPL
ncbi:anti-sigma factor RsbA family regulatory protein [Streptomyces kanasensis]|uniref:anti-sigma factor RsbA family regulatory protein n=1 Tax=Streptomyces kanasensis TaxID=936756 RepID=UPI0036F796E3